MPSQQAFKGRRLWRVSCHGGEAISGMLSVMTPSVVSMVGLSVGRQAPETWTRPRRK